MIRRAAIAAALVVAIAGCGYDGSYRYECQDPENWEEDYCNPPICLVDGMCTETLIGFDPENPPQEVSEDQEEDGVAP
ncbi:hypothetical protein [Actinomycetia phage DSL-LC01]|nr:hypothetical protein [Actinomycetia phage DSL-LC01]